MGLEILSRYRRRDIQILRGLAVISVVLFHAEPNVFKSGFLGVDAFFVISGFVITPLMVASIENRSSIKYPVLDFYRKRIYRFAPAFGVTIMVSILLIFLLGNLKDHERFFKQSISALLLVGNFSAPELSGDYFHPNYDHF